MIRYPFSGGSVRLNGAWLLVGLFGVSTSVSAQTAAVTAIVDQTCAGDRANTTLNCTANDFTASVDFTQPALGAISNCFVGEELFIDVIATLSSSSPVRYDVGLFVGQNGQDPGLNITAGANNDTQRCSLGVFPITPAPFFTADADVCGDFQNNSTATLLVNDVKVYCQPVSATDNRLNIPFLVAFDNQISGSTCTAGNLTAGTSSKCTKSSVGGVTGVTTQAYLEITKQTEPDLDPQVFSFNATASTGTPVWTTPPPGSTSTTATLTDGQTKRVAVPIPSGGAGSTNVLTLTESLQALWDAGVEITCAPVAGSGNPVVANKQTRVITASFSTANFGATCTITNTKRSRITLAKQVGGRVNATDQFTVSATTTGDFQDLTNAPLTSPRSVTTTGTQTSVSTVFTTRQRVSSTGTTSSLSPASVTLSDVAAGTTSLSDYDTRLTCTNAFSGPGATPNASLPNALSTVSFTFTPAPGDNITCTYTNTPRPRITLQKAIAAAGGGRVAPGDQFQLNNGANSLVTTGSGASVTSPALLFVGTAGNSVTLSEAAAGSTVLANYSTTISCSNANGSSATVLPSGSGTSFALTPANNDVISCILTNTRRSGLLRLQKTWSNAFLGDDADLFTTGLINNAALASDAGAPGETDTGATVTVFAGESATLAETLAGANTGSYTASAWSCSGGTLVGASLTIGAAAAGTTINCSITNARRSADLRLTKTNTPGVNGEVDQAADTVVSGATTQYTIVVLNNGPDAANGAVITDPAPTNAACSTASCSASAGATCPAATGAALVAALQGAGAAVPTLPAGGQVTIVLTCTVN